MCLHTNQSVFVKRFMPAEPGASTVLFPSKGWAHAASGNPEDPYNATQSPTPGPLLCKKALTTGRETPRFAL